MGTIAQKLNKLLATKADIKQSITEKGVTVPNNATFASYPEYIDQISTGIEPNGNKAITASTSTQSNIDVAAYATVSVAPTPSETKSTTTNGDVTPSSGKLLSKVTVNVPTGTARSSSDVTAAGATVTIPAGLYSSQVTKTIASGSATTPATTKQQSAPTFSLSGTTLTANVAATSVNVTPNVTAGYVSSGTAGTITMSANSATYTIPTQTKTATTNGTITPDSGKFLSSVTVAVPVLTYYTGNGDPSNSFGSNGDIYINLG